MTEKPKKLQGVAGRNIRQPYEVTLPEGANPTQWNQLVASRMEDEISIHRFMDCVNYAKCLHYASGQYWEGWSCHWCPLAEDYREEVKLAQRVKAREEVNKL